MSSHRASGARRFVPPTCRRFVVRSRVAIVFGRPFRALARRPCAVRSRLALRLRPGLRALATPPFPPALRSHSGPRPPGFAPPRSARPGPLRAAVKTSLLRRGKGGEPGTAASAINSAVVVCARIGSTEPPPAGLLAGAWLSEKPHQGVRDPNRTLHQAIAYSKPLTASGLPASVYDSGRRSRCSGKERDQETGLD